MKKILGLFFIITCVLLLSGCNSENNQDNSSNGNTNRTNKVSNDSAKSVGITAKGDYLVGTDIMPGSYYAVLSNMEYGSDDEEEKAYVQILVFVPGENKEDEKEIDSSKMLKEIGEKHKFVLQDGDEVTFSDNWDPTSWEVKLLNESDYRAYTKNN